MSAFHIFAAATYWLLIVLWAFILTFYLIRLRRQRLKNALFVTLIVVLAIDAFRSLFESLYFGVWYTALAGLLPEYIQIALENPGAVLIPKLLNVLTAAIIILILLRRWIPEEEAEMQAHKNREHNLQVEVATRTQALDPKQAYDDGHFRIGAGRRLMARTVPPALCDGYVVLGCCFVILTPGTCWGPTRAGTSIPRRHEANSTPQRPIHPPAYGIHAS